MNSDKKVILSIVLVISAIIIFSWQPGFTGYSIIEDSKDLTVDNVLPGEIVQSKISFSLDNEESIIVDIEVDGDVKNWIVFTEEEYILLPYEDRKINFYINVPSDTEEGEYSGKILVIDQNKESFIDNQIIEYFTINIIVSPNQIKGARVNSLQIYDSEIEEEVYFKAYIENIGNTPQDYEATLEIYNSIGQFLYSKEYNLNLLGYENKAIIGKIENELTEGNYYARMLIENDGKSDKFQIVGDNELKINGEIKYVNLDVSEENVKTRVYFYNTGDKVWEGSIQGSYEEKEFETESQIVFPNEYKEFEYNFKNSDESYALNLEGVSGNIVLDEEEKKVLAVKGINFESNIYLIFIGLIFLLIVLHYVFTRKSLNS